MPATELNKPQSPYHLGSQSRGVYGGSVLDSVHPLRNEEPEGLGECEGRRTDLANSRVEEMTSGLLPVVADSLPSSSPPRGPSMVLGHRGEHREPEQWQRGIQKGTINPAGPGEVEDSN